MLSAWTKNADHAFFDNMVKKVHWLGFSSTEKRTALQSLDDFLSNAPVSRNVQISTVGYTQYLNPGDRAGVAFLEGAEKARIQVGIKLRGDTTYATTLDSYTTNPRSVTKSKISAAKAGEASPPAFRKTPRLQTKTLRDVAHEINAMEKSARTDQQQKILADYLEDQAKAKAKIAVSGSGSYESGFKNLYDEMDPKWNDVVNAVPEKGDVMLDSKTWSEPFSGMSLYNEVVLDNWEPAAIILNPRSATLAQIEQFKNLADQKGLKLLDLNEKEILLSDFARSDRSDIPLRQSASPKTKQGSVDVDPVTGYIMPSNRATDDEILDIDNRARQYESALVRWGRLAGLVCG